MDTFFIVIGCILAILLVIGIGGFIFLHMIICKAIKSPYEWLGVLSHHEWKTDKQLSIEMARKNECSLKMCLTLVDTDLRSLAREELIEGRLTYPPEKRPVEWRLTSSGIRRKNLPTEENSAIDWSQVRPA